MLYFPGVRPRTPQKIKSMFNPQICSLTEWWLLCSKWHLQSRNIISRLGVCLVSPLIYLGSCKWFRNDKEIKCSDSPLSVNWQHLVSVCVFIEGWAVRCSSTHILLYMKKSFHHLLLSYTTGGIWSLSHWLSPYLNSENRHKPLSIFIATKNKTNIFTFFLLKCNRTLYFRKASQTWRHGYVLYMDNF